MSLDQATKKEIQKLSTEQFLTLLIKLENEDEEQGTIDAIIYERGKHDFEAFAFLFFAHYCEYDFNPFHRDIFERHEFGKRNIREADAAPRGYAKSTLKALVKPIHDVCYGQESFIVIISDTHRQSVQKLRDIRDEIDGNDLLNRVYGTYFKTKNPGKEEFTVYTRDSECLFMAFSRGASIRGIRKRENRPSKIVLDDVENAKEVINEMLREKDREWFFEDVTKIGNKKTNIEFIGTILHDESLLKTLIKNPAYNSKVYKAVISWASNQELWRQWEKIYQNIENVNREDQALAFFKKNEKAMLRGSEVLWPHYQDYYELMLERAEIGHRAFMKEKQNEPQGSEDSIFDEVWWYSEESEGLRIEKTGALIPWSELRPRAFGAMDPSAGQNKKPSRAKGPDFTSIVAGYKSAKGRVFCHEDFTKRVSPSKYIREIYNFHERYEFQKFGVESNLFRKLLLKNIVDERKRYEKETKKLVKIPVYEIYNTENKVERIYRLEPKIAHGWIVFNKSLSQEFKNQMMGFPTADHDDGPDALEMFYGIIHGKYKIAAASLNALSV